MTAGTSYCASCRSSLEADSDFCTGCGAANIQPPQGSPALDNGLPRTVRTMGMVAISLMAIGLITCVGWLNYLNFAFSSITLVLSIVALTQARSDSARSSALIGLTLVILADFIGVFTLISGGGCR